MNFVPRAEWGARAASTSTNITPVRTLVHWEGPHMGTPAHDRCAATVRGIQAFHMDGNGWADIAYSLLVCSHGYVYEGRGLGHRTAANGTNESNQSSYAICYLGGEGDPFTDAGKDGINDAIAYLGQAEVGGHRDATHTACPGEEIYAWVQAGHPRGNAAPAPIPAPAPDPGPGQTCESQVWGLGASDRCVVYIQRLLNARRFGLVDDGDFGPKTRDAVRAFQRNHRLSDDGAVGPATWKALWWGQKL